MSLFKSSNTQQTTQNIETRNIGASDSAVVAGENVTLLDGGAISEAFDFAGSGLSFVSESVHDILGSAKDIARSTQPDTTIAESVLKSSQATQRESSNLIMVVLAVAAVAFVFAGRGK